MNFSQKNTNFLNLNIQKINKLRILVKNKANNNKMLKKVRINKINLTLISKTHNPKLFKIKVKFLSQLQGKNLQEKI